MSSTSARPGKGRGSTARARAAGAVAPRTQTVSAEAGAVASPPPDDTDGLKRGADSSAGVPEPVSRVAEGFAAAGRSFYLVGGYTRDLLLGKDPKDIDAATDASPEESKRILNEAGAEAGWEVGEKYGTVAARIGFSGEPDREPLEVEVTTYRSETYEEGSRKPKTSYGVSLQADLARRDFTINAIALDPLTGKTEDPHGGEADLASGTLRCVGDPDSRFEEDPLRMMRAVRFQAKLGLRPTPETEDAMRARAASLDTVSRERVRDEVDKSLATGAPPSQTVEAMRRTNLLGRVMPDVAVTRGVTQEGPHHDMDVYGHTLAVADALPADSPGHLKLAALYHDTGKPETKDTVVDSDGTRRSTFYGHEEIGAEKCRKALGELRYDGDTVAASVHLCREHMRPNQLHTAREKDGGYSEKAVRRFAAAAHFERGGKVLSGAGELLALNKADIEGHAEHGRARNLEAQAELSRRVDALSSGSSDSRPENARSPLDGTEIVAEYGNGAGPGKWVGDLKAHLESKVRDGDMQAGDKEAARREAEAFVSSRARESEKQ